MQTRPKLRIIHHKKKNQEEWEGKKKETLAAFGDQSNQKCAATSVSTRSVLLNLQHTGPGFFNCFLSHSTLLH